MNVSARGATLRVVSLVPSLTEAVAETVPTSLVGCTHWCTHPGWLADSGVARVGGTKNPDLERILELRPDLVLSNEEENRPADLEELRRAGLDVLLTTIRTVPQALSELDRLIASCGWRRPAWLDEAESAWAVPRVVGRRRRALVPIWRRPWMAIGSDTYTGDVLARLGIDNVLADSPDRYPRFDPTTVPPDLDLLVLPDEPYRFTAADGPEAFPDTRYALVDGRLLTWYGPAMVPAARELPIQLGS